MWSCCVPLCIQDYTDIMIRTIVVPEQQEISVLFHVPQSYIGKEVEIIAFSKGEVTEDTLVTPMNKPTFNAISIDTLGYTFNRDEANER